MEQNFSINCRGKLISLRTPKIMGILNLTPDSFSDGGRYNSELNALKQTEKLVRDGADIIDIGAQSTRPGAEFITAEQEIRRIGKVLQKIKIEFPEILVSVDTFFPEVVRFSYDEGADVINDISGGQFFSEMFQTVAATGLPYILMHSNPDYHGMHEQIKYDDLLLHLNKFFSEKVRDAYQAGIHDVIIDPGFGFGKTVEDQFQLINEIEYLGFGKYPILAGISKKSFMKINGGSIPEKLADDMQHLHNKLIQKGVQILRVHDVAAAKRLLAENSI